MMISNGPGQYDNTLQIRLLGGDPPDIYATGADKLIMQAKNGYVLDITNEPFLSELL